MAVVTSIEWTDRTWNPVTGCTKVSQGCRRCYAERLADRFWGDRSFTDVRVHPERLDQPTSIRRPSMIFVNSMSDLFHSDVEELFIRHVFDVMVRCPRHTFQVLTKRSERLASLGQQLPWPPNIWMGVSVESEDEIRRIDHLRAAPAVVRFLSLEPLIGPLPKLDLREIHWVIVGGESGPQARPMDSKVGPVDPPPMPGRWRAVLLQAVGGRVQEAGRPAARRTHLRRVSECGAGGLKDWG